MKLSGIAISCKIKSDGRELLLLKMRVTMDMGKLFVNHLLTVPIMAREAAWDKSSSWDVVVE
jgi:hypothetical protein